MRGRQEQHMLSSAPFEDKKKKKKNIWLETLIKSVLQLISSDVLLGIACNLYWENMLNSQKYLNFVLMFKSFDLRKQSFSLVMLEETLWRVCFEGICLSQLAELLKLLNLVVRMVKGILLFSQKWRICHHLLTVLMCSRMFMLFSNVGANDMCDIMHVVLKFLNLPLYHSS